MFENLNWGEVMTCTGFRWQPGIGDPTLGGWLTVVSYAVCAGLAARAVTRAQKGRERGLWVLIAVAMLALAANKQLDLQSALTAMGRCISQLQGWYHERREVQRLTIEAGLGVAALMLALGLYLMRQQVRRNALAMIGLGVVAGFVAVRAVSFHHFDMFLKDSFLNIRHNFLLENSGLVLIALNALWLKPDPGQP